MLLYALLHLAGFGLAIDELKAFRQWGSRTPGHPERGLTPGVETTTGPLGAGLSNAVGMAIAEAFLAAAQAVKSVQMYEDTEVGEVCGYYSWWGLNLGRYAEDMGRWDEAIALAQNLVRFDPGDGRWQELLEKLRRARSTENRER